MVTKIVEIHRHDVVVGGEPQPQPAVDAMQQHTMLPRQRLGRVVHQNLRLLNIQRPRRHLEEEPESSE